MSKQIVCDICGCTEEMLMPYTNGKITTFSAKGFFNKDEFDICGICLAEIKRKSLANIKKAIDWSDTE